MKERFWRWIRPARRALVGATLHPKLGAIEWGHLRSTSPIGRDFGVDRGTPVDRAYIEAFLDSHRTDVHGHVMEVGTDRYSRKFGGDDVVRVEVTHNVAGHPHATMVVDLTKELTSDSPGAGAFDCIICTQTLHVIYDVKTAVSSLYGFLKPGGVLLLTSAGISQISRVDMDATGDHWRFTEASMRALLSESFPSENVEVRGYGNVLSCIAFLHGIALEELDPSEIQVYDPEYQMLIAARAVRPG